jgi:hypothetical protein
MKSNWTKPEFKEIAMDCEIGSYFDDFGDEQAQPLFVDQSDVV